MIVEIVLGIVVLDFKSVVVIYWSYQNLQESSRSGSGTREGRHEGGWCGRKKARTCIVTERT